MHHDPHYGNCLQLSEDGTSVFSARKFLMEQSRSTKLWINGAFVTGIRCLSNYKVIFIHQLRERKRHPMPDELMNGFINGNAVII